MNAPLIAEIQPLLTDSLIWGPNKEFCNKLRKWLISFGNIISAIACLLLIPASQSGAAFRQVVLPILSR